jgi:hypothetical protein
LKDLIGDWASGMEPGEEEEEDEQDDEEESEESTKQKAKAKRQVLELIRCFFAKTCSVGLSQPFHIPWQQSQCQLLFVNFAGRIRARRRKSTRKNMTRKRKRRLQELGC